jgi:glycosyltransferase involved in cell wall biosynthesis
MKLPRIVFDLAGLDGLYPGAGLFRYATDLVRALVDLNPAAHFVVLGARPAPIPELAEALARQPGRWIYRYFPRSVGFASAYRDHLRVALTLARVRAQLYHCLSGFAPVAAPCPVIVTVHDLMYELFPEYTQAIVSRPYRLYRWAARNTARRLICSSRTTAADVHRLWRVPEDRLDVVHLGTAFTAPTDDTPVGAIPAGVPVVASVFNLEPRKNLASLVAAFPRVLRELPTAKLVLFGAAGIAPGRVEEFEQRVATAAIGGHTIRTGFLTDQQLAWLYRRAEVFVFPSLYEGFGYPVVEALAAGSCVVARGTSAMAEVLGDAGVKVETANPDELAAVLLRLLTNSALADRFRRTAPARAGEFSLRKMAEGTCTSYEKALQWSLLR